MTLAESLKIHQELKDMTTQELAEKANIPADTISKIRCGATRNPNMDTLKRLACALGCTLDELADMPTSKESVRDLMPRDLPQDPEALAEMFCGTLRRQQQAHEAAIREVRRDRRWWRRATIGVTVALVVGLLAQTLLLIVLYWDLSNPTMGNITYGLLH